MTLKEMFGNAIWVCAGEYSDRDTTKPDAGGLPLFPILRGHFTAKKGDSAKIRVAGLGFFTCRVNGQLVSDDKFLPLSTDYEPRVNDPVDEEVKGHRLYVPEYDISQFLQDGDNVMTIHFGGGWYTVPHAWYGFPKAIYRITVGSGNSINEFISSPADKIGDSFVKTYYLTCEEIQDARGFDEKCFGCDFDDSLWPNAIPAKPLETDYLFTDCPADRVIERIQPKIVSRSSDTIIYDAGRNLTGYPVFKTSAPAGTKIEVVFSEELDPNGGISEKFSWWQKFHFTTDGAPCEFFPHFTWFGFRYFSVKGDAEVVEVDFIHSDIPQDSEFHSGNAALDWLYTAYTHTQLCNMHAGIPSDCPHIERRGYTGDGELCAHAAMDTLGAKAFYRKWIEDISDCQDVKSGHVQYTAPYIHSGGGPGAWGCAIVEVPYEYYLQYGDIEPAKKLYPQMLEYFRYLEDHSENGLVTSDKPGEWCLGDWCTPMQVILPAPFVNNYYYVKSLKQVVEIAKLTGHDADIPALEAKIEERKATTKAAYYNTWDNNFIGALQGANAFAIDMGIGTKLTYDNLVAHYRKIGYFDTGICGTDVVTRVLFEHGDGELALSLLTSEKLHSYYEWSKRGATTLWEYWPDATRDRSHSHPMFGAATAYLFDYILGIRQEEGSAGFEKVIISPFISEKLPSVSGARTLPKGKLSVSYKREGNSVAVTVTVPAGITAKFVYGDFVRELEAGKTEFMLGL